MLELIVLADIANTPGKNDKMKLLSKCNTDNMKTILYLTFNKFLTYRIQQLEYPKEYNTVQPDVIPELEQLLLGLAKHDTGSVEARRMIKRLLAKCTEDGAKWVVRIIQRDLNIGIDERSVNRVFPGLIPVFNVQLANKMENWDKLKYPLIVEEKLDGMRTIAIVQDGVVSFYSREGRELFGLEPIAEEILRLMPGASFVLDGELIGKNLNPRCKTAVKNKDGNWAFAQALSMVKSHDTTPEEVKEYLGYYVWDVIDVPYFLSQGTKGRAKTLLERKFELIALFERNNLTFNNLFMVPNAVALNKEDVLRHFETIRAKKGEGVMLKDQDAPYCFKRNDAVLKLKEFFTMDLRVRDAYEGEPDTKYVGMLGGLVMVDDTGKIETKVGSGYTDDQRTELWLRHLNGNLVGSIMEICSQEVTIDGSLRFPTFVRERPDKTTTSLI